MGEVLLLHYYYNLLNICYLKCLLLLIESLRTAKIAEKAFSIIAWNKRQCEKKLAVSFGLGASKANTRTWARTYMCSTKSHHNKWLNLGVEK